MRRPTTATHQPSTHHACCLATVPSSHSKPNHLPTPHFFLIREMADQSGSAHFQAVFDSALEAYEKKAGVKLAQHPLAMELQNCDCVDSIITLLRGQAQDFRHKERIMKSINTIVSILTPLSLVTSLPDTVGLVRRTTLMVCLASLNIFSQNFPPATAIHTGIGILLDVCTIPRAMCVWISL